MISQGIIKKVDLDKAVITVTCKDRDFTTSFSTSGGYSPSFTEGQTVLLSFVDGRDSDPILVGIIQKLEKYTEILDTTTGDFIKLDETGIEIKRIVDKDDDTKNTFIKLDDAGVTISTDKDTNVTSTLSVDKATTLKDTLEVDKATSLKDTLDVDKATTLKDTLDVDKAASLKNTLEVSGATTLNSTFSLAGFTVATNTFLTAVSAAGKSATNPATVMASVQAIGAAADVYITALSGILV